MAAMLAPEILLPAAYFLIPAYTANSTPLLLGGGPPLDHGKNFIDGKRIFGANKTIRGFIAGLVLATFTGVLETLLLPPLDYTFPALMIASGSLCGDLVGAFIKRRINLEPGSPLPLLDQLDFIFGALLFANPTLNLEPETLSIIILITPPIHLSTNTIAYLLKLKDRYW